MNENFIDFIGFIEKNKIEIIPVIVLVLVTYIFYTILKIAIKRTVKKVILRNVVLKVVKYVYLFILIMLIFSGVGIDITPILASFSILGLAISIGSQKIVEDFLSGVFIVAEDHYNIGDTVSVNDFRGTVIYQGLRITKIQNYKGEILTLSNRDVINVINYSTTHATAIIDFPVSYNADYSEVTQLIEEFTKNYKNDGLKEDLNYIGISKFSDTSYFIKFICSTTPGVQFDIERDLNTKLYEAFVKNGIEMPSNRLIK